MDPHHPPRASLSLKRDKVILKKKKEIFLEPQKTFCPLVTKFEWDMRKINKCGNWGEMLNLKYFNNKLKQ